MNSVKMAVELKNALILYQDTMNERGNGENHSKNSHIMATDQTLHKETEISHEVSLNNMKIAKPSYIVATTNESISGSKKKSAEPRHLKTINVVQISDPNTYAIQTLENT